MGTDSKLLCKLASTGLLALVSLGPNAYADQILYLDKGVTVCERPGSMVKMVVIEQQRNVYVATPDDCVVTGHPVPILESRKTQFPNISSVLLDGVGSWLLVPSRQIRVVDRPSSKPNSAAAPGNPPANAATEDRLDWPEESNACTDAWLTAYRKNAGDEAPVNFEMAWEWVDFCRAGKRP